MNVCVAPCQCVCVCLADCSTQSSDIPSDSSELFMVPGLSESEEQKERGVRGRVGGLEGEKGERGKTTSEGGDGVCSPSERRWHTRLYVLAR